MKKHIYRSVPVNRVPVEKLRSESRLVLAVDVAKTKMVAAFSGSAGEVLSTTRWTSPVENGTLMALLEELRSAGQRIEVVMEPSGTYDDALRHQLQGAGFSVFRVACKRTHDAREVYDGVPSLHDAKSAAILAKLHLAGVSRLWEEEEPHRRELKASISTMDLHSMQLQRLHGSLEAQLARYWPELCGVADIKAASILALVARIGGPADVAKAPEKARRLLRGMSHRLMKEERIEAVIATAESSCGVAPLPAERTALMELASEAHRSLLGFKKAKRAVELLSQDMVPAELPKVIGKTTAAVVVSTTGDPRAYDSARAFVKACGLNLREKSSGNLTGQLHLTKRGPAKLRRYLWLAALRLIQTDDVIRAWYVKKVARDGGVRKKALVAIMRKLAQAIYVVAGGEQFDSSKLFDTTSLDLAA